MSAINPLNVKHSQNILDRPVSSNEICFYNEGKKKPQCVIVIFVNLFENFKLLVYVYFNVQILEKDCKFYYYIYEYS